MEKPGGNGGFWKDLVSSMVDFAVGHGHGQAKAVIAHGWRLAVNLT